MQIPNLIDKIAATVSYSGFEPIPWSGKNDWIDQYIIKKEVKMHKNSKILLYSLLYIVGFEKEIKTFPEINDEEVKEFSKEELKCYKAMEKVKNEWKNMTIQEKKRKFSKFNKDSYIRKVIIKMIVGAISVTTLGILAFIKRDVIKMATKRLF